MFSGCNKQVCLIIYACHIQRPLLNGLLKVCTHGKTFIASNSFFIVVFREESCIL